MAITINGSGTIGGVSVGGLPDGIVDTDMLASGAVTSTKLTNAGKVLGISTPTIDTGSSTANEVATYLGVGDIYYLNSGKLSNTYTKQSNSSILLVHYKYGYSYLGGFGAHNMVVWKDSSTYHVDSSNVHQIGTYAHTSVVPFTGLSSGSHTFYAAPGRNSASSAVNWKKNASGAITESYLSSFIYIVEVET
jgi:hypothetical protein